MLDDHRLHHRHNLNGGLQRYTVLLFERLPRHSSAQAAPAQAAATNDIDAAADNVHRMLGMPPSRYMAGRSAAANGIRILYQKESLSISKFFCSLNSRHKQCRPVDFEPEYTEDTNTSR